MSKYYGYYDVYAKCPYYQGSTNTDVRCEGVGGCSMILRFPCRARQMEFRARRCDTMEYERCELYKAHE